MLTLIITGLTGRAPFTALILISIFSTHVIVFLFLEFVFILVFLFLQYLNHGRTDWESALSSACFSVNVYYVFVFVLDM